MIGAPCVVDAAAGPSGWDALVRGRVAFVRTDARCFELRPVAEGQGRALSEREAAVLRACCLGQSNKVVAHALRVGPGRVSTALAGAARKLGAPSGRVLVQLVSGLVPCEVPGGLDRLTAAEREVAMGVGQGLTNQQIAHARGCSVRTVANQIASIFRKTGLGSRRAVMVALRLGCCAA